MDDQANTTSAPVQPQAEAADAEALLRHLLAEHFSVFSDGHLTWSYREETHLCDIDTLEFEKALIPFLPATMADKVKQRHLEQGL